MCPPSLLVKEKDILYTVQTFHKLINHYSYSCVARQNWPTRNALSSFLLPWRITRPPSMKTREDRGILLHRSLRSQVETGSLIPPLTRACSHPSWPCAPIHADHIAGHTAYFKHNKPPPSPTSIAFRCTINNHIAIRDQTQTKRPLHERLSRTGRQMHHQKEE